MAKKTSPIVVNVNRNRLLICGTQVPAVVEVSLTSDMVSDLTVVDQAKLEAAVAGLIQQNKLTPAPAIVILASDICFEQDIARLKESDLQIQIQKFLDTVPLTSVSSKVFETDTGYRVVAISRDFYEVVRTAFEKLGFTVQVVVPGYVLGAVGVGDKFDLQACQLVIRNLDTISQHGFELEKKPQEPFSVARSRFFNTHKFWVLLFFVVSLTTLAVVAYLVLRRPVPVLKPGA